MNFCLLLKKDLSVISIILSTHTATGKKSRNSLLRSGTLLVGVDGFEPPTLCL